MTITPTTDILAGAIGVLLTIIPYIIRLERRMSSIETKLDLILTGQVICPQSSDKNTI